MEERPPRPTAVTVLGCLWLGLGGLMLFSGAMAFMVHSLVMKPAMEASGQLITAPPAEMGPVFGILFKNFGLVALLQVAFAVLVVFSAAMFLRLRPWARVSLEVATWLALSYILIFGVLWVSTWVRMVPADLPANAAPISGNSFRSIGAVMGSVITLVFAVPIGAVLYFLRSQSVRGAFVRPVRPDA